MSEERSFTPPVPNKLIMRLSGTMNEWGLLFGLPIFRRVPFIRQIPPFGGYFKVSKIIIPDADRAILKDVTDPNNAFFFGPNHPEFTTDWLIDKYVSVRFAPRMSSWAASSIIRGPLARFWSANNLIGNDGGEAAKNYSVQCALAGHGTLLHPEGTVRWRSDKVFDLLPGIVDMALDAATRCASNGISKKVFIVPLVWKIVYHEDIRTRLNEGISKLEKTLKLSTTELLPLGRRYVTFHQNLLAQQMRKFDPEGTTNTPRIDDAQRFFDKLLTELAEKYDIEGPKDEIHRLLHKIFRKAREAKNRRDTEAVIELQRLAAYSRDTFEKKFFYQEEIAEGLQSIRQIFLTGGYDSIRSMLPKPFGWRNVYLHVPAPIEVSGLITGCSDTLELSKIILKRLKESMDATLNVINRSTCDRLKVPVDKAE